MTSQQALSVGLVHNWPGKRNSEWDIAFRLRALLEDLQHQVLILDPLGYVLDENANRQQQQPLADDRCDLVINLHYLNPKFLSGLSYTVNWNPIEYILNDPITGAPVTGARLNYLLDCLRSHDRVLSAGSEKLDRFAALVRRDCQAEYLPNAELALHTTIASNLDEGDQDPSDPAPNADNFAVFYIGMNWEKLSVAADKKLRHDGLLELLDDSGRFRFFGLREQGGVFLWEGIKHYQGEIPFDGGKSIAKQSRRCGVTLVLSSSPHRASAVVSTRIFQACAVGAIVISDRNPFVERHFGNSVLYFDYGASNQETASAILDQVRWIEQNWQAAQEKAARAREVFVTQFALEQEVRALCDQARCDLDSRRALIDSLSAHCVAIHYLIRGIGLEELERLLGNAACQNHENIVVYVYAVAEAVAEQASRLAEKDYPSLNVEVAVLKQEAFTTGATLVRAASSGEAYHLWYSEGFKWRRDQLLNLLAVCELQGCRLAYAPYFASHPHLADYIQDSTRYFIEGLNGGYSKLSPETIQQLDMRDLPLGNILIAKAALQSLVSDCPFTEWMDLAAVAMAMRNVYREEPGAIGFSPVISAIHVSLDHSKRPAFYSEHAAFSADWRHAQARDRALVAALENGKSILPTRADHSGAAAGYGKEAAEGLLVAANPEDLTKAISERFSIALYLTHLLRNRPFLRKAFMRTHGALARLLKLN